MQIDDFSLRAPDGVQIKGKIFRGASEGAPIIVVAGAIGISSSYYFDFCKYCQYQGFTVINYDYRGIGGSESKQEFDLVDWFEKDFETVLSYALEFKVPVFVVGHSFGALCATVSANKSNIKGLVGFGTGSGALEFLPFGERMKALLLFYLVGPILFTFKISIPRRLTGMQFNIPLGFFKQWRALVKNRGFWLESDCLKNRIKGEAINYPIKIYISEDDLWTPIESARDYYSRLSSVNIDYEIVSGNGQKINHSQYFNSKRAEHLWPSCIEWIRYLGGNTS